VLLTFEQALEANTGHVIQDYDEFLRKRDRLKNQSRLIAEKLEKTGISTRDEAHDMWAIGELTGCIERLPARYRHIQIIPSVAKADRAVMIRDFTYFLERHAKYARYAVITSGRRVAYGEDLRARRNTFHANIRRWSNEARERYGVELLYRGDEYTHAEDGAHLHANIVYQPTRKLTPGAWSAFLSWSKRRLGGVIWKDCGRLKDAREVVKYCCKLGEDGIDRLSSDRLAWFHDQTFRSKVSQPLGSFAAFRKQLEADGLRIVRVFSPTGSHLAKVKKASGSHAGRQNATGNRGPCENIVIGRQLPAPRFSSLFEPVTLVMGYTSAPMTGVGRVGLDILRERSEQARKWAGYNLDTNTPTVQAPISSMDMEQMPDTESALEGLKPVEVSVPAQGRKQESAFVHWGAKSFVVKNGQKVPRLRGTKNHIQHKSIPKHKRVIINNGQRVYC